MTVTDGTSPGTLVAALSEDQVRQRQDFAIQQNITALSNRVDALGVAESVVQRQGLNRIAVQLPGVQDASEVVRLLGKVATLEFRLVDTVNSPARGGPDRPRAPRDPAVPRAQRLARCC